MSWEPLSFYRVGSRFDTLQDGRRAYNSPTEAPIESVADATRAPCLAPRYP